MAKLASSDTSARTFLLFWCWFVFEISLASSRRNVVKNLSDRCRLGKICFLLLNSPEERKLSCWKPWRTTTTTMKCTDWRREECRCHDGLSLSSVFFLVIHVAVACYRSDCCFEIGRSMNFKLSVALSFSLVRSTTLLLLEFVESSLQSVSGSTLPCCCAYCSLRCFMVQARFSFCEFTVFFAV